MVECCSGVDQMVSVKEFGWIVKVPIGIPLCIIGILGNLFSIIVWHRIQKKCRTSTNSAAVYLVSLGVFDIGFLVLFLVGEALPTIEPELKSSYSYAAFYSWFAYPVINFFFTATVWLVVGVTMNRFIFITFPLKSKDLCSKVRTQFAIVGIICLAVAVNVPHFFNYHPQKVNGVYKLMKTKYGASMDSKNFHFWCHCIMLSILPWFVIAAMNFMIVRKVKTQTAKFNSVRGHSKSESQDYKLTTMLLGITFTLLFLLGFQCITQCLYKQEYRIEDKEFWENISKFYALGRLAWVINATINSFLYCFSGRIFTSEAKRLIMCATPLRRMSTFSSKTTTFVINQFSSIKNRGDSVSQSGSSSEMTVISHENAVDIEDNVKA